jgi:IS5 family transposase
LELVPDHAEKDENDKKYRQPIFADSAYKSKEIDAKLQQRGFVAQINEKVYRNHPLTDKQKANNYLKSKNRNRIEHIFDAQKMINDKNHYLEKIKIIQKIEILRKKSIKKNKTIESQLLEVPYNNTASNDFQRVLLVVELILHFRWVNRIFHQANDRRQSIYTVANKTALPHWVYLRKKCYRKWNISWYLEICR